MAATRNRFFIPYVREFFGNILLVIRQCNTCLEENNDGDQAELLARRVEQYLRVMHQRITESRPDLYPLHFDLEQLMVSIRQILERLEGLSSDNDNVEDENRATGTDGNLCSTVPNGHAGRPAFLRTEDQIRGLREGADFRWSDIARILGVSTRTLSHHRQGFGMPVGQEHNFSQITDFALDNVIRNVLTLAPQSGVGLVRGALRSRGL